MTNVNKKTAGKNKDSEKTTESKSPVTVKQMPDGTFEFSGGRGGFNIVAQKNKALEPYGKCIWNYRGRRKPRARLPSGNECSKQSDPEQLVVRRSEGNWTRA